MTDHLKEYQELLALRQQIDEHIADAENMLQIQTQEAKPTPVFNRVSRITGLAGAAVSSSTHRVLDRVESRMERRIQQNARKSTPGTVRQGFFAAFADGYRQAQYERLRNRPLYQLRALGLEPPAPSRQPLTRSSNEATDNTAENLEQNGTETGKDRLHHEIFSD